MKPLFCVLAVLLFATPAQAGHKVSHSPPGHELLCDCVISEVRQSVFENSERLVFDRLEPYAGEWLHAEGEYTEKGGLTRRVAVSIGPEHGT
ncbi:hypothetical protein LCGC14_2335880, partial [marine sediment metagenome]